MFHSALQLQQMSSNIVVQCLDMDKYTLLHELACTDMHVNECNKMFIIHTIIKCLLWYGCLSSVIKIIFLREVPSKSPFKCIDSN